MRRIKLIALAVLIFVSTFILTSCSKESVILDNSDKSYFVDFYTSDDKVYIECVINVVNTDTENKKIKISAYDKEDVETGLLKEPVLTANDKMTGEDSFIVKPGENKITVVFMGDYAGIYQISSRSLPRFIKIEQCL